MKLSIEKLQANDKSVQIVKVDGYLDAHTFPGLERVLQKLMNEGERHIILDFATLDYISSAGLGLLLGVHRLTSQQMGGLKIINMQEPVHRVFDVLGFSRVIEVCASRDAAIEAFRRTT
ncbi:MAG TPA: STAS domain-containing protein [Planctomycetota bacterium]|nr:STAS domain-containing protein [Planctomycetota bacterium]